MARLSSISSSLPADTTSINLKRLIARLRETLIVPDAETEKLLRRSSLEREKVAENVEYARNLLIRSEQDALNIKVQSRKQEVQAELVRTRAVIERFQEVLEELNEAGDVDEDGGSSEGEDILGEDTPSETDDQASQVDSIHDNNLYDTGDPIPQPLDPDPVLITQSEPTSVLRSRFPQSATTASEPTVGISTATAEALLTHNRTEQEALTTSLLSMASLLKQQSRAFAASLEDEKGILENTGAILDKNESGMDAAQRRMGYLRGMTEGRGWLGRMLMYAWIAGLMVVAILIVFVLPKLRF